MTRSALADRVPVPVVVVTADGEVVRSNDAATAAFDGATAEADTFDQRVLGTSEDTYAALLNCEATTTRELDLQLSDGLARCPVTATPVDDGVELVVDTTNRDRRFVDLLESINDPVYILDDEGRIEFVNDAFETTYGYGRESVVGEHVTEFLPADAVERGRDLVGQMVADEVDVATLEFQGLGTEGSERWAEVNIGVLENAEGDVTGTVGVLRDVTARKRRERELASFETIAETAPIPMFTVDEDGDVRWANRRLYERFDMTQSEVTDRPFYQFVEKEYVDPEMLEQYVDFVRDLLSSETDIDRVTHEEVLHPPGESDVIVDAQTSLLPLEDGEFTGTVNAFRDVTQRKAYREELERQNERLEAFASLVSHDLRNPLTVAFGYLDAAREGAASDPVLDEIERSLERMDELIEDLLTLARQGQTVGETDPVAVESVARASWETVPTGDAALVLDADVVVESDRVRLKQLFENLFRNALEHAHPETPGPGAGDGDPTAGRARADPSFAESTDDPATPESTDDPATPESTDDPATPESTDDPATPERTDDPATPERTDDPATPESTDDTATPESTDDPATVESTGEDGGPEVTDGGNDATDAGPLTVTVGEIEDGFYVADDGVGLPEHLDPFEYGVTTAEDGSGLGLTIVAEVVDAHGWTITAGESEAGGARFDVTGVTTVTSDTPAGDE